MSECRLQICWIGLFCTIFRSFSTLREENQVLQRLLFSGREANLQSKGDRLLSREIYHLILPIRNPEILMLFSKNQDRFFVRKVVYSSKLRVSISKA